MWAGQGDKVYGTGKSKKNHEEREEQEEESFSGKVSYLSWRFSPPLREAISF